MTLIEVSVTATLVSLLVLFVVTMLPSTLGMFRAGREMTAAEDVLRTVVETCRSRSFDDLVGTLRGEAEDPIAHFSYRVDVAEVAGFSTPSRLKELTIRVAWSTRQKERELVRHVRLVNVPK